MTDTSRPASTLRTLLLLGSAAALMAALMPPPMAGASEQPTSVRAAAPNRLAASLNGAREVPGPGDPNGLGHVRLRLRPAGHKVCAYATWSRIGTPIAAHVHRGGPTVSGPVVIDLSTAVTGGRHCKGGVSTTLIRRLKHHPRNFYFNIHTQAYQAGAIRGQLHH